jgi:hypothetical protein
MSSLKAGPPVALHADAQLMDGTLHHPQSQLSSWEDHLQEKVRKINK